LFEGPIFLCLFVVVVEFFMFPNGIYFRLFCVLAVVKAALEEFASLLGDSEQRQQLCKYLDAI